MLFTIHVYVIEYLDSPGAGWEFFGGCHGIIPPTFGILGTKNTPLPGRSRNDIIYLLKVINYIFRNGPVRENYVRAVPAGNRAAFFTFDNFRIFGIIYLTRQPEGECTSPAPANILLKNSRQLC